MSVKVVSVLFFVALILSPSSIIAKKPKPSDLCFDAIDIVQIQSIVSSSKSRWSSMTRAVGNLTRTIKKLGSDSYFGFATFGDKNIAGVSPVTNDFHILGSKTDRCLHVDAALGKPDSAKLVKLFQGFQKKAAAGRTGDWFDNVFEGVYRTFVAPNMKWRPKIWNGKKIYRIAIVVVDTVSHLEGDVLKLTGKKVRPFDITERGMKRNKNNENYDCDKVDYTSVKQLVDMLNQSNTGLLMLVSPGGSYDSKGKFTPFEGLANMGAKYRREDGLKRWYEDQLRQAKFQNFHAILMDPDLRDITAVYGQLYQEASRTLCRK